MRLDLSHVQVASLWLWLSFRFKERFPGQATAQVALAKIIALMDLGLENLSKINEGEDARVRTRNYFEHQMHL